MSDFSGYRDSKRRWPEIEHAKQGRACVCSYRLNFEQGYRLNFDQAFLPRVIAAAVDKSIPDFLFPTVLQPEASISICAGKAVQGEARNGVTCAGRGQNGSASLAFSRALIRD